MFDTGDTVLYSAKGICKITGISEQKFGGSKRKYYVLEPVYQKNSSVFIPADNEKLLSKMKPVLTKDEIDGIIHETVSCCPEWIENENERKLYFSGILAGGSRKELILLIKTIYEHRRELTEKGKKLHACDEVTFKEAEALLYDEFAYVLGIKPTEVVFYIMKETGDE